VQSLQEVAWQHGFEPIGPEAPNQTKPVHWSAADGTADYARVRHLVTFCSTATARRASTIAWP